MNKLNIPAWCLDIPADEYHQATKDNEFLSSHRLNTFRKCPLEYYKRITGEIVEGDTPNFIIGRATHTLILEDAEKFAAEYTVGDGPINPKTEKPYGRETAKFKEWAEAQTLPVIGSEEHALMLKMRDAVLAHEKAAELLSVGKAEVTVRAEIERESVQARLDWFDPSRDIIVDLKTCNDLDRFTYDIRDFGYIHQLAFYALAVRNARVAAGDGDDAIPSCWLIAVEKREPFRVAVYHILHGTVEEAVNGQGGKLGLGIIPAIRELRDCRVRNYWPTRFEGFGEI